MKKPIRWIALLGLAAVVLATAGQAAAQSQEDLPEAQRYYLRGTELMNNRKLLDAVEQFQLAIDADGEYVDAYRRLAYVYTEMAKTDDEYYQDALDTYEDLAALLPEDEVEVKKNIAFVQAAMGDMEDAIGTYEDVLEITPDDCQVWGAVGLAHKTQGDRLKADGGEEAEVAARLEKAAEAYRSMIKACPDDLQAYNALGELYFSSNNFDAAAKVYADLLAKDPENVDIASKLGFLYYRAEDWTNAAPVYKQLLDVDPSRSNDRGLYAKVLENLEKWDQAADQYMKLIETDPDKKGMFCNLGFLYIKANNGQKAIESSMKGISENAPQQGCLTAVWAKGLELRGVDLYRAGSYDPAITSYQEAKLKFGTIQGDADFGDYATKQIARLDKLIQQAQAQKEKAKQEGGR